MKVERSTGPGEMIERWDGVFGALAAEPRRQIVLSLSEAPPDRRLSLPQAANPPYMLRDPEPLAVELRHTHLPVLTDEELIVWDADPFQVGRGSRFDEVATVMEAVWDRADRIPDALVEGCQRLEERREG